MTKELLQQALNEAKADAIEVFTHEDGIAQSARDAIEYMHSWLGVYFEKQALAQPASVDAYVGAREDAAIWKKRALEAEELNRKFIAEVNGPTYLGEPVKQEQPAQEPVGEVVEDGNDFGRVRASLDSEARVTLVVGTKLYTHPAPTRPAQTPCGYLDEFGNFENTLMAWMNEEPGVTWAPVYTHPAPTHPALKDDVAIWKKRALEAEELNRKFIAEVNGPTYLGEPAHQEQPVQKVSESWTDIVAVNLVREGVNKHKARELAAHFLTLFAPPTQPALSDDEIWQFWCNRPEVPEGEDDSMEAEFVAACKRAIEAHCLGGANHG